jgi:hypothetical protein
MTDLPPRPPLRTDDQRGPQTRYSQTSMWLVFLVLAAVILAAIAFSVDRSTSVVDPVPAAIEPAVPEPSTTAPAPTETAPADTEGTGTGTTTPATPAPDTGGTTAPAP